MRFATLPGGSRDGRLVLVSADHRRAVEPGRWAPNLLMVLERWGELEDHLRTLQARLDEGRAAGAARSQMTCSSLLRRFSASRRPSRDITMA